MYTRRFSTPVWMHIAALYIMWAAACLDALVPPLPLSPRPPLPQIETASSVLRRVTAMYAPRTCPAVAPEPLRIEGPDRHWRCAAVLCCDPEPVHADAEKQVRLEATARKYTQPDAYIPCRQGFSNSKPPAWSTIM